MKRNLITFVALVLLFRISFAQEIQKSDTSLAATFIPEYIALDVDQLLTIEDVSPELSLDGRKPLFLIHGWSFDGNPAPPTGGYWENIKQLIKSDPELRANFKPYYVRYWSNYVTVKEIGAELRKKVEEAGLNDQKIAIIGHSMGGLVARSYMNEQTFTTGISNGKKCGDNVDLLITLSSPHHGSPMANGPARNAKVSFLLQVTMSSVETAVFKETKYDQVNRSDLHWDNFDNLFDYQKYSDEKNDWLVNLNKNSTYDSKTICYSGSVQGQFLVPGDDVTEQYKLGAWFMEQGFGFTNDGIVPIQSSQFQGHTVKKVRYFSDYNHADIIIGKSNKDELFTPLKTDLMDVAPLKLNWPSAANIYLKHSQYQSIDWDFPSTVKYLNIYLSTDNGATYSVVASNVKADAGKYSWFVPDLNSSQCLIKIEDADFPGTTSVSLNTFTIFHNLITVTSPKSSDYFVRYKNNTIYWKQEGLGHKVKLIYSDSKNNIEKVIAEEVATQTGTNTYNWAPDESLPPTNVAVLKIQLLELYENFNDTEIYTFSSTKFQMLGDPGFTIVTPETSPTDFFGVEGEQYEIGSLFAIKWKAQGEIKFVELFLCDKNKNILQSLTTDTNLPALESNRSSRAYVPEFYGDEFYLFAQAGFSSSSIQVETYSEKSFRINKKVKITLPSKGDTGVSLHPCFGMDTIKNATRYTFYLQDTLPTDQFPSWQYESISPMFCAPEAIQNELQPGMYYQLTAVAQIDTIQTFADHVYFTAEKTAPWAFNLLAPENEDSTQEHQVNIVWTRSVGVDHYILTATQNGKIFFENNNLSPTDTTFTLSLNDVDYYSNIKIKVVAMNAFGNSTVAVNIIKRFRTDISLVQYNSPNFGLKNYPNPLTSSTTFEFNLPTGKGVSNVSLVLFDLTGRQIETITEGEFNEGMHRVVWHRRDGELMQSGNYIYQLKVDGYSTSKMLQIK